MDKAFEQTKVMPAFNDNAPAKERGAFEEALRSKFGGHDGTVGEILEAMKHLQIPLPTADEQFVSGQAGLMLFSNKLGVSIRIETEFSYVPDDEGFARGYAIRANDSAAMLQPIGAVKAGKAVIEVMPGIHWESRDAESRKLYWKAWADGYDYWDERIDNTGRLPDLPGKPGSGVAVILDRLAAQGSPPAQAYFRIAQVLKGEKNLYKYRSPVRVEPSPLDDLRQEWEQMVEEVKKLKPSLETADKYDLEGYTTFMRELDNYWPKGEPAPAFLPQELDLAMRRGLSFMSGLNSKNPVKSRETLGEDDPQEILYGKLRKAFNAAWKDDASAPDVAKMAQFWREVVQAKKDGVLVAGWSEVMQEGDGKSTKAAAAAKAYDAGTSLHPAQPKTQVKLSA